jgi:phosphatidylglycerophosphate synthase
MPCSLLILADESANWNIGGLRQLDRLALAANEYASDNRSVIDIFVFWKPGTPASERWLPNHPRLRGARIAAINERPAIDDCWQIVSTRLLVARRGLGELLEQCEAGLRQRSSADWDQLNQQFESCCRTAKTIPAERWRYLSQPNELCGAERWLLHGTGKSYDGVVSTYLNRPLSRVVSQMLLHFPVTPNQWTFAILLLPLLGAWCFSHGTFFGFVLGATLYQLHSILDGCDGEIARVKYLDSKQGPGIDALGDLIALLLFVTGLSFGLFHASASSSRWLFLVEGAVAFLLIGLRLGPHTRELLARGMDAVLSSEHDELLRASGQRYFGRKLHAVAVAMTGRDVVFLAFLVLALVGLAPAIMHLLFFYSLGAMLLLHKGRSIRSRREVRPVLP